MTLDREVALTSLIAFESALAACRFCPMCKPASDIASLSKVETESTRSRAMLLWRIANGFDGWTDRSAEILWRTTLDSISEAWCVSHYPVSSYMLAARRDAWAAGVAPVPVREAVARSVLPAETVAPASDTVLIEEPTALREDAGPAIKAMRLIGIDAERWTVASGVRAFVLGAHGVATDQARRLVAATDGGRLTRLVCGDPATRWMLGSGYRALGIELPPNVKVVTLTELLDAASTPLAAGLEGEILLHDSRAASLLAHTLPSSHAIAPDFDGDDTVLGQGAAFDAPRRILGRAGAVLRSARWTHALARSCGADDALPESYPELADELGLRYLQWVRELGVSTVVADAQSCAWHLKRLAPTAGVSVAWLPEILAAG